MKTTYLSPTSAALNPAELYKTLPPKFGHALLKYFGFDPRFINLNNGSFGALPLPVLSACIDLTLQTESNPDYYLRMLCRPLLVRVRERIAKLIGAEADECVMIPNTSHGITTILRNFEWEAGDIIIVFNTTYGTISRTIQYLSDIPPYPAVSEFRVQFPTNHSDIVSRFRDHLRSLPRSGNPKKSKVVAVIDSICSNPGVLMPWKELVQICREAGVWSVVDAAHSIGQEVGIDLKKVKPDFWVSNCHKWLYAKRSCAILYVPKRNQHVIKTSIPTSDLYVSSSSRDPQTFIDQFEWNGTTDFVPYLSVSAALDFRNWIGGEVKINAYCHSLALAGGKRLAEVMGTTVMDPHGDLTVNMVNVELPFPAYIQPTSKIDMMFKNKLLVENKIYSAHYYHNGRWWTRCSAQIWNEIGDFEKLGKVYNEVCSKIVKELGLGEC